MASRDNTVVGMIGIGDMGAALAGSIMRSYSLVVFDVRAAGAPTAFPRRR
jgi:3-hydroxyisobutyrate dehydrogenase-like beta-hydroxyacid dehydrogenase